jgi:hypothetical protein
MKLHADWLLSYFTGVVAIVGYCLWLAHQGTDPTIAIGVGLTTFVVGAVAILLSQDDWERARARQLEESNRGFPWRRFAYGNSLVVILMGMFFVDGWSKTGLEFGGILIFGVGNCVSVIHWLIQRRVARRAGGTPAVRGKDR